MTPALPARLPLFGADACAVIAAGVEALRGEWTGRHALPAFTLGASAYLDIPGAGLATYLLRARRLNRVLRTHFPDLHERLRAGLAEHLTAPVVLTHKGALPGFHLFEYHPELYTLAPSLHFDRQHEWIGLPAAAASRPEARFSFTALLSQPRAGAGLLLWPLRYDELSAAELDALPGLAATTVPERVEYRLGELFVHDGDHLHQIDAGRRLLEGEMRLTLQGHGLWDGKAWQLYW